MKIRSLLFWALTGLWTVFLSPFIFFGKNFTRKVAVFWARGVLYFLQALLKVRVCPRGLDRIRTSAQGFIVASQHQSALETLVFSVVLDCPIFVLKSSLLGIPFFGWGLRRAGMISVSSRGLQRTTVLRSIQKDLEQGRHLVIFPEGTRAPSQELLPFKKGIFFFYQKFNLPVLPVALNTGLFWRKGGTMRKGTAVVSFLEPIPAGLGQEEFFSRLSTRIAEEASSLWAAGESLVQ